MTKDSIGKFIFGVRYGCKKDKSYLPTHDYEIHKSHHTFGRLSGTYNLVVAEYKCIKCNKITRWNETE